MTPVGALAERLEDGRDGPPRTAKRSAVLVLLGDALRPGGRPDDELERLQLIYTRRREDLRHHPGQVSFPGGRVEPGEQEEAAALREAAEEIGLDPATVTVLGRLPTFYLPPSRYWLTPVVAHWNAPHELRAEPGEVGEILSVPVSRLVDVQVLRAVRLSVVGWSWAWQLDERHLLWGATGRVTDDLLSRLDVGWPPVPDPSALPSGRLVEPWRDRPMPPPPRTSWLPAVDPAALDSILEPADVRWRRAAADVVARAADGRQVVVVSGRATGPAGTAVHEALTAAGVRLRQVDATEPSAGEHLSRLLAAGPTLVVDALAERAGPAPLARAELAVVERMRAHAPVVVAVDVPSGLDARHGLVGEVVTADLTVSAGPPAPAIWLPGVEVFTGDVVVVTPGGPAVIDRSREGAAP